MEPLREPGTGPGPPPHCLAPRCGQLALLLRAQAARWWGSFLTSLPCSILSPSKSRIFHSQPRPLSSSDEEGPACSQNISSYSPDLPASPHLLTLTSLPGAVDS